VFTFYVHHHWMQFMFCLLYWALIL